MKKILSLLILVNSVNYWLGAQCSSPSLSLTTGTATTCTGQQLIFTAGTTETGTVTYQLYKDGLVEGPTQTTNTWTISNVSLTDAGDYTAIITDATSCSGAGESSPSSAVTIAVNETPADPTIAVSPNQTTFCAGEAHTLTASSTVGSGTITYTWSGDGSGTTNPINGTTTAGSYTYTVSAEANGCTATNTASETITVNDVPTDPTIAVSPNQTTFCAGEAHTLTASSTVGSGTITYTWSGDGSGTTNPINGTTTAGSYTYTVSAEANGCTATNTASETITVNDAPTDPTIAVSPNQTTFCAGDAHTLTASSTVGSGTITYTWSGDGSGTTNPINGTTTAGGYTYTVSAEANGCTAANTASETITVTSVPTAVITGDVSICNDGTTTTDLTVTVTDGTGPFDFTIFRNGGSHNALTGETSPYTETVTSDGVYTLETGSLVDANGCAGTVSGSAAVTSIDDVMATTTTKCAGDSPIGGVSLAFNEFQIVVNITQGDLNSIDITETSLVGGITWTETSLGSGQWYSSAINSSNTIDINVTDVNDCNGGIDLSSISQSCVCPASVDNFSITDGTICQEGNTTITVEYSGGSSDYNITLTQPDASTQILNSETGPSSTFTVNQQGNYSVSVLSNGESCSVSGSGVNLAHHNIPVAPTSGGDQVACESGQTLTASATVSGGFSLDWYDMATNGSLVAAPDLSGLGSVTYYAESRKNSNSCVSATRTPVSLTLNETPTISVTNPAACNPSLLDYSVEVTVSNGAIVTSNAGTVVNIASNVWEITVSTGVDVVITSTLGSCTAGVSVTAPSCTCPTIAAPVSGGDQVECETGQTLNSVAFVGSDEVVDWYDAPVAGSIAATSSLTGVGTVTLYAEARNTTNSCTSSSRTAVTLTLQETPSVTGVNIIDICERTNSTDLEYTVNNGVPNEYTLDWDATSNAAGLVDVSSFTALPASPILLSGLSSISNGTYFGTFTVQDNTSGCQTENSVSFTVHNQPLLSAVLDFEACDSFTLPSISGSGLNDPAYYAAANGGLPRYNVGDVLSSSASLFIYDQSNTTPNCTDQETVALTINSSPTVTITDVTGSYNTAVTGLDTLKLTPAYELGQSSLSGLGVTSDINGYYFDPAIRANGVSSFPLVDSIQYTYISDEGCSSTATYNYTIYDNAANILTYQLDGTPVSSITEACQNGNDFVVQAVNQGTSLKWSTTPVGSNSISSYTDAIFTTNDFALVDVSELPVGDVVIQFTSDDPFSSGSINFNITVEITKAPVVSIDAFFPRKYCLNSDLDLDQNFFSLNTIDGDVASFEFSGSTLALGDIQPIESLSDNSLQYTVTNSFGCTVDSIIPLTINDLPVVTLSLDENIDVCKSTEVIDLSATISPNLGGSVGTFSSSRLNGDFAPNIDQVSISVYSETRRPGGSRDTIVYSYKDPNNCMATDTIFMDIVKTPSITDISLEDGYCTDDEIRVGGTVLNDPDINDVEFEYFIEGAQLSNQPHPDSIVIDNPIIEISFDVDAVATDIITGCYSDKFSKATTVYTIPSATFRFLESSNICSQSGETVGIDPETNGGTLVYYSTFDVVNRFQATELPLDDPDELVAEYTVVNPFKNECAATYIDTMVINPTPMVVLESEEQDLCLEGGVTINPTLTIDTSKIKVSSYDWSWRSSVNGVDSIKTVQSPTFYYQIVGAKSVRMDLVTDSGCVASLSEIITVSDNPNVDFSWTNVCEGNGESTFYLLETPVESVTYVWDCDTGDGLIDADQTFSSDVTHTYASAGDYEAKLTVTADNTFCVTEITKTVSVVPTLDVSTLTDEIYSESFESDFGDWLPFNEDGYSKNRWASNVDVLDPANTVVSNFNYYADDRSFVMSPCFDISTLDRPMFKMDLLTDLDDPNDGVIVEYRNDSVAWKFLGEVDKGVNWFDQESIASNPGSSSGEGWTGQSLVNDTLSWIDARYKLDEFSNNGFIQFRIAFASNSDSIHDPGGVAFDNIQVGNRQRVLLGEYFTNTQLTDVETIDDSVNQFVELFETSRDLIKLEFHTSAPIGDQLNNLNPSASSIRESFYSIIGDESILPHAVYNGNIYEGTAANWVSQYEDAISNDALLDPKFSISLQSEILDGVSNNRVKTLVTYRALDSLNVFPNITLFYVEKTVDEGGRSFKNVVKGVVPYNGEVGGVYVPGDENSVLIEWSRLDLISDQDRLMVVAIIQDPSSGEIYQTAFIDTFSPLTSVQDPAFENTISVYPNPLSSEELFVESSQFNGDVKISLYDANGVLVESYSSTSVNGSIKIDSDLSNGVYFISVESNEEVFKEKVILNR